MNRRIRLTLFIVIVFAFLLRSIPAWTNAAWGNDIGVYYGLTNSFVKYGTIFNTYEGWGGSYEYFPILYILGGVVHILTGLSIMKSLTYTAPVFGALTALLIYFIVNDLFANRRLALISAAFVAVNPIHLYQTSHAAPLTIGHFFMLSSLYFFLRYSRKKRFLIPLVLTSALLIMSHHLTTYMYIISLGGMILFRNAFNPKGNEDLKNQMLYLLGFTITAFSYWLIVAGRYFSSFMKSGTQMLPLAVVIAFYVALMFMLLMSDNLRKYLSKIKKPEYTGNNDSQILSVCVLLMVIVMVAGAHFITIPGTTAKLNWKVVFISLPLVIILAFTVLGLKYIWISEARAYILGWLIAITLSASIALITGNRVLFPDRHFEYLMEPLSIVAGLGVYSYYRKGLEYRDRMGKVVEDRSKLKGPILSFRQPFIRSSSAFKGFISVTVILVIISSGISSYPMRESVGGYNEDYSHEFMSVLDWMFSNLDKNLTVAADHRLAQVIYGKGEFRNLTYEDDVHWLWFAEDWRDCLNELNTTNQTRLPPVSFIVIDHIMLDVGVQEKVGVVPEPMTPASYAKFSQYPFNLLYRNATDKNNDGIDEQWAEVFKVEI